MNLDLTDPKPAIVIKKYHQEIKSAVMIDSVITVEKPLINAFKFTKHIATGLNGLCYF